MSRCAFSRANSGVIVFVHTTGRPPLDADFERTLHAARAGQEWAWNKLYRDLAPQVRGYLRARGATEPDDLTGEVFLQVVRDMATFSGGRREFCAWLFTVAHHRLLDDVRRSQRRPLEPAPDEVLAEHLPAADAEEDALRSLAAERVKELVGKLSPDQRTVLLLRILGDLSIDEVARVAGKTPGAVKALQRRGLASIKREISKEEVSL
jgi:RNA polymerase sigma-70 factor (ECF subfamily)